MAPFSKDYTTNFTLHADDIEGIQSIYGYCQILQSIVCQDRYFNIETFLKQFTITDNVSLLYYYEFHNNYVSKSLPLLVCNKTIITFIYITITRYVI